jgi:hypothetical protein
MLNTNFSKDFGFSSSDSTVYVNPGVARVGNSILPFRGDSIPFQSMVDFGDQTMVYQYSALAIQDFNSYADLTTAVSLPADSTNGLSYPIFADTGFSLGITPLPSDYRSFQYDNSSVPSALVFDNTSFSTIPGLDSTVILGSSGYIYASMSLQTDASGSPTLYPNASFRIVIGDSSGSALIQSTDSTEITNVEFRAGPLAVGTYIIKGQICKIIPGIGSFKSVRVIGAQLFSEGLISTSYAGPTVSVYPIGLFLFYTPDGTAFDLISSQRICS